MECALFYPFSVPPTAWLKQSLLYYDVLGSIVPPSFEEKPPPDIAWLVEQGVFEPVHIDDLHRDVADRLVEEVVDLIASAPARAPDVAGDVVELHEGKLPRRVVQELEELDVIIGSGDRLAVQRDILVALLSVFARHAAAAFTVPGRTYSVHTTSIDANRLAFEPSLGAPGTEVGVAIRAVLPTPREEVAFEDILEFRANHRADLLRLRRSIEEVTGHVRRDGPYGKATRLLLEAVEEEHLRLQDRMRRRGWHAALGTVVAVATGAAAAHLAPGAAPWVFSGIGSAVLSATVLAVRAAPMPRFSYIHDAAYLG